MSTGFSFTYQQDPPRIVTLAQVTSLAYDQALYVASEFTVEKAGDVLYHHPRPIQSIAVQDPILYVCDGTVEVTRYHLWNTRLLKPYVTSIPSSMLKIHQSKLYVLCRGVHDQLVSIDLHTQVSQVEGLDPARSHRSLAFDRSTRYLLTVVRDTQEGRIHAPGMDRPIGADSADLVLVYPYLYISGTSVQQLDLRTQEIVQTYETLNIYRQLNRYTSMTHGPMTHGPMIYLANVTRNQVESIVSPPIQKTEVRPLTLSPSTGTTYTVVTVTGDNLDQVDLVTLNDLPVLSFVRSPSTLSFQVPEGVGTPVLRFHPQRMSHKLTFTYQNPMVYRCLPSECFEGQTLYLYGEFLDQVRYVIVNGEKIEPVLIKNALSVRAPAIGPINDSIKGSPEIILVDHQSNVIYTSVRFTYIRLESVICFPAKTLVHADQGVIEIQKLIPGTHTVYGKKIRWITDTYCLDKELVFIEKDAFAEGCPYQDTVISRHHKIWYRGRMIEAQEFVGTIASWVPYDGSTLYNVLLYEQGRMNVQGMICETLDPSNPIVHVYAQKLMDGSF